MPKVSIVFFRFSKATHCSVTFWYRLLFQDSTISSKNFKIISLGLAAADDDDDDDDDDDALFVSLMMNTVVVVAATAAVVVVVLDCNNCRDSRIGILVYTSLYHFLSQDGGGCPSVYTTVRVQFRFPL